MLFVFGLNTRHDVHIMCDAQRTTAPPPSLLLTITKSFLK